MSGAISRAANGVDLQASADQRRQEALFIAERAKEQGLQTRVTALQLAVQVCGGTGNSADVLSAATDFTAFILGDEPATH